MAQTNLWLWAGPPPLGLQPLLNGQFSSNNLPPDHQALPPGAFNAKPLPVAAEQRGFEERDRMGKGN